MYETNPYFYGTGRRKESVARVRVYAGTGKITINDRDIDDYFGLETLKLIVRQPLAITDTTENSSRQCFASSSSPSVAAPHASLKLASQSARNVPSASAPASAPSSGKRNAAARSAAGGLSHWGLPA